MLIVTGVRMARHDPADTDPGQNLLVRLTQRLLPVTDDFHGKRFFVRLHDRWHATPLFLALAAIELSDVVFAIDSVPAIFALTNEPWSSIRPTSLPSWACDRCTSCWQRPSRASHC